MGLTLTLENETNLPDGGPLSVTVTGKRGLDIGRDQHLDWTLPDPTRYISSKHCEIRYREGGYWLYDVSTNGTYLNGSDGRLKAPHRLRDGDRLTIGKYIVAVALDGEGKEAGAGALAPPPAPYHELWASADDAAPPINPKLLRSPAEHAPVRPDFLHWAVDVPDTSHTDLASAPVDARPARSEDDDMRWASGPGRPPPHVETPPAVPAPRRPVWASADPSSPWGAPPPATDTIEHPTAPDSLRPAPAPARPPSPFATPPIPPGPSGGSGAAVDFVRHVAQGANLPEHLFARDPEKLAEELGVLIRLVAENMRQLLNARLQAKRLARMSNQTTIEALNNNPLKFSPTSEDALRIMFGPPTRSYLDARRAFEEAFDDLKQHQLLTYSAMQQALAMLVADLDPQAIDTATETERGISGVLGSRKAKLWDAYVARWQAKTRGQDGGMVDVFMQYFAECYDRSDTRKP